MSEPTDTTTPAADEKRALRKTRVGVVVSDKMNKTRTIEIVSRVPHPKFGKIIKQSKHFHVHDEENKSQVGDRVRIAETRPYSKTKRWRLLEVLAH